MPYYMDIHEFPGGIIRPEEVAKAHAQDLAVQEKYGVSYHKYWVNEKAGKAFCLCRGPSAEAAEAVHREAHGGVAQKIIQVEPDVADLFMGGTELDASGAVMLQGAKADTRDPAIRTILFTDIVESTSLTRKMGDEAAMKVLRVHDSIVRQGLDEMGGCEIKHLGDGIMASFVSAAAAVKCATRIQQEIKKRGEENEANAFQLRVGIAAGEPVEHHDDLFGCTVQLAARLCAHARPEEILVSNVVAELCEEKCSRSKISAKSVSKVSSSPSAHTQWLGQIRKAAAALGTSASTSQQLRDRYRAMARTLGFEGHIARAEALP